MKNTVFPFWLQNAPGVDKTLEESEVFFLTSFTPSERVNENRLFGTKWFDYRRLHPAQCVYYIAELYRQKVQVWVAKTEDYRFSRFSKGLKNDLEGHRELFALNQVRRHADSIGVPYNEFLSALEGCLKETGWLDKKMYPRPSQFLEFACDSDVKELIYNEFWEGSETFYAKDPYYSVSWYRNEPDQIAYEDYLVNRIHRSQHKEWLIGTAMYLHNQLRLERVVTEFGWGAVRKSQRNFLS